MPEKLLQRRWPWLAVAGLVVLAWLATVVRVVGDDTRPAGTADDIRRLAERNDVNLLFILVDTLRAERISGYGYARNTSPGLDLLAASGVRFAHQLSQSSWTKCSMASLWTSLYPAHNGITRVDQVIPDGATLPAEIFRAAGFRTAGLYRNGWVAPNFGFGQGFEVYDRPVPGPLPPSVRRENPTLKEAGSDVDAVDAAIEFLRVHGHERWMLYLHLMDVHEYLYDAETSVFGTSYSDIYDNAILHLDQTLDHLFTHLAQNGYLHRTLIVVSADHGEAFRERGFEGHAREVYRETTEVPWLLAFPFRLEEGVVVDVRTQNVDVWPTVLDLLGLPPLPRSDGRSRVPEILAAARGEAQPSEPPPPAIAHIDRSWGQPQRPSFPNVAVVEDGLRYVTLRGADGPLREELFDSRTDPKELVDVRLARPEDAERLRAIADAYLESGPAWEPEQPLKMDQLQLNQLRALGYALP